MVEAIVDGAVEGQVDGVVLQTHGVEQPARGSGVAAPQLHGLSAMDAPASIGFVP